MSASMSFFFFYNILQYHLSILILTIVFFENFLSPAVSFFLLLVLDFHLRGFLGCLVILNYLLVFKSGAFKKLIRSSESVGQVC